ncbi:hypothetical protein FB451DRAFT_1172644 [Mycena latifolia]|nr:hypothetical protein FB451DRAFT_1172644 [Mycena latifolia]
MFPKLLSTAILAILVGALSAPQTRAINLPSTCGGTDMHHWGRVSVVDDGRRSMVSHQPPCTQNDYVHKDLFDRLWTTYELPVASAPLVKLGRAMAAVRIETCLPWSARYWIERRRTPGRVPDLRFDAHEWFGSNVNRTNHRAHGYFTGDSGNQTFGGAMKLPTNPSAEWKLQEHRTKPVREGINGNPGFRHYLAYGYLGSFRYSIKQASSEPVNSSTQMFAKFIASTLLFLALVKGVTLPSSSPLSALYAIGISRLLTRSAKAQLTSYVLLYATVCTELNPPPGKRTVNWEVLLAPTVPPFQLFPYERV